ncbi:hypothetical protein ACQBAR_00080 [Propionibacteriaceae bacterium Y1685]
MTSSPQLWLDAESPSSSWPRPQRLRGWQRVVLIGGPVLLLVLLLSLVGLLGGFEERRDHNIDVRPGDLIETGPVQLTFDSAETWQTLDYDDKPVGWTVLITGMGRNVGTETARASVLFACADPKSSDDNDEIRVRLPHLERYASADFQPGLPMVPFTIECEFPPEWTPGTEIQVGVKRQKYVDLDPLGLNGEQGWRPSGGYYAVLMPYEVTEPRLR